MAFPLHSFMQDLLSHAAEEKHACRIALVVDNAHLVNEKVKKRSFRKRDHPDLTRWKQDYQKRLSRNGSLKSSLDISDHTKKESRWESTMTTTPAKSNPVTPLRAESDHGSPRKTRGKQLSPVMEENRKASRKVSKRKILSGFDCKPELFFIQRSSNSGFPLQSLPIPQCRNSPGQTLQQVDEAIAICSKPL